MNAIEFIKASLDASQGWVGGIIADMKDAPLTRPTPKGGNHPLWILGHLAYSEGDLVQAMIAGKPNPLADWKEIFGQGSEPSDNAAIYPSFDKVTAKFAEVRAATLALLGTLSEADLDKPSHAPESMKAFFGTTGDCLKAVILHYMFHGGQAADARRAAGRKPLMA